MNNFDNEKLKNFDISNNNEIDLRLIINFLIRNKLTIASYSFAFFIVFCLVSLTLRRVWSGQFQIVVNNDKAPEIMFSGRDLGDLFNIPRVNGKKSLDTEIGILESPSVLMPVFNFVNNELQNKGIKPKISSFTKWKTAQLNIDLKKKTSILNITYKDSEKDLILPVLKKISGIYQEYSGKGQRRTLELSKNYLIDQIDIYKKKSSDSIRSAQSFAMDKDLTTFDLINSNPNFNFQPGFIQPFNNQSGEIVNIEVVRLKASNKIKNIDNVIKKIEELGNDTEDLQYIGLAVPLITRNNTEITSEELIKIDAKLIEMRSKYTNKNKYLKRLEEERKIMAEMFKKKTIGLLKAERLDAESRLQTAKRPKDVLLAYRELIREAKRDENTLTQLEDNLRTINLEEKKLMDPWELITDPTLDEIPVGPRKKIIGMIGLLSGAVFGLLISLIKEKKSNFIFDTPVLESLLDTKIIEKIKLNSDENQLKNSISFVREVIKNFGNDSIRIFTSENLDNANIQKFCKKFKISKERIINQSNNFSFKENEKIIYLASISSVTFKEVNNIRKKFNTLGIKFAGILLIID